jgi:uncharacterized Zn finger protein
VKPSPSLIAAAVETLDAMGVKPETLCPGCRKCVYAVSYGEGEQRIVECTECGQVIRIVSWMTSDETIVAPSLSELP